MDECKMYKIATIEGLMKEKRMGSVTKTWRRGGPNKTQTSRDKGKGGGGHSVISFYQILTIHVNWLQYMDDYRYFQNVKPHNTFLKTSYILYLPLLYKIVGSTISSYLSDMQITVDVIIYLNYYNLT